jgi:hypothetical protein
MYREAVIELSPGVEALRNPGYEQKSREAPKGRKIRSKILFAA